MTSGDDGDPRPGAQAEGQASPENAYAEFRVRIERGVSRRSYRIVASGPSGQVEARFKLPFSDLELENFVLKVGGTRKGVRSLESPEMELAKAFGGRLFSALFETDVRGLYRASTVEAANAGQGLRITLALTSVPELLRVPWEYLYDRPLFPSTDRRTPIVRYLDLPKPIKPFQIQLPLRILAIVSAPVDAAPIDAKQERSKLEEALAALKNDGAVEIDWLEEASLSALYRRLSSKDRPKYHILHFIGHGGYVNEAKEGVLLFEDKDGRRKGETGDKLGTILHTEDSLRLAVLNSCEGARTSLQDPFSGVATSLIEHEIPAVIGMQFEITDRAAILFSGEFYAALADGRAVDESVSQARMAIFADNNDLEWGTPVLFMRVTDGRLFDIQAGPWVGRPPKDVARRDVAAQGQRQVALGAAAPEQQRPQLETVAAVEDELKAREAEAAQEERQPREAGRRRPLRVLAAAGALVGAGLLAFLLIFVLPGTTPTTRPILFYSHRDGDANLYAVDPSTRVVSRLTDDTASDTYPAWSPDGTRIAFDSQRGGSPDIWVRNADGRYVQLTHDARADGYPAWSPVGDQVAWAVGPIDHREIWVMSSLDGHGARSLTTGKDDWLPSWSKTGLIAFERRLDPSAEIWVVDPSDGHAARYLTDGSSPAWSPNGERLALTRKLQGRELVYIVDANGRDLVDANGQKRGPLTPWSTCPCTNPTWSPDGSQIAYEQLPAPGTDGPDGPITVISASYDGHARQVTDKGLGPSWGG